MTCIDFHGHVLPPGIVSSLPPGVEHWPLLADLDGQLAQLEHTDIDVRVICAPPSLLAGGDLTRANDWLARQVERKPDRLRALASIDAFAGEAGAAEVDRAVAGLGLAGIVVDCSTEDGVRLDHPLARPTLQRAAELGAPVFVHPISPRQPTERLTDLGHAGVLLARGTEDAASVLALLRSGIWDELAGLVLVIPLIAVAALMLAGSVGAEPDWSGRDPASARRNLYFDTMGFDPATIRYAVDVVGADHVLLGSDWPIMPLPPRGRTAGLLAAAALTPPEIALVSGENAERILRRAH